MEMSDLQALQLLKLLELYFSSYPDISAENISAAEVMDDLKASLK